MRLFSWAHYVSLAAAAGAGYFAGESVHRHDPAVLQVFDAGGELSEAPPSRVSAPQAVEEIDLTCLATKPLEFLPQSMEPPLAETASVGFLPQSMEPPLADSATEEAVIRAVRFDLPVAAPVGPDAPATMPYLTDDWEPALLPPLGDVPLIIPTVVESANLTLKADPDSPIYQAVKRFFSGSIHKLESPVDERSRASARTNQEENLRQAAADWRRIWMNDPPSMSTKPQITDKVPIGQPPVSEHPSAVAPERP